MPKKCYTTDEKEMLKEVGMSKRNEHLNGMGLVISNFQDGTYFYNKGIQSYREKDLKKAKRYLERAVQLDEKDPVFICQLAIIHADLGDFHRSNDCLLKIIDLNLDEEMSECYFFLANNYANLGLFEHARKEALHYIEKDPEGEFLEDVEDLLEVLQEEDELFAEAENFLIRYEFASHELKNKNYEKAIAYFTDLIKEEPQYWMAHIRLAEAYYCNQNTKKAIDILKSVIAKEDNITARCHLMTYYYETGQIEKAQSLLRIISNVWSVDDEHSYQLAICLGKVGEHEQAYKRLEQLQRNGFGDFPKFFYHLAVASFYTGRVQKAISLWEKLATVGSDEAIVNLNFLQAGHSPRPSYNYTVNSIE